jgi:hypothetical protein
MFSINKGAFQNYWLSMGFTPINTNLEFFSVSISTLLPVVSKAASLFFYF